MKVNEAFPSKFLKADDLQDRTVKLTIDRVEMDEVGDGRKPIAYFKDAKKGLVLNVTNARAIATLAGDDMDTWTGTQIELFSTPVTFKGQVTEAFGSGRSIKYTPKSRRRQLHRRRTISIQTIRSICDRETLREAVAAASPLFWLQQCQPTRFRHKFAS